MEIKIEGQISAGHYNAQEACPCFYLNNEEVIDNIILRKIEELGYSPNFAYRPFNDASSVQHPLIGRKCKITIEIED